MAAQLAAGLDPRLLGPAHELDVRLSWPEAQCVGRRLTGCVWLADSFGNLMTNVDHALVNGDAAARIGFLPADEGNEQAVVELSW